MSRSIITGIDIGTHNIKVVIADGDVKNKILGIGLAESRGLRHGYIINTTDAVASIKEAVSQAEKKANVKVRRAFISIGGIGLGSITSSSSVIITRADSEITALDIKKVQEQCEKDIPTSASLNKKIIHSIPIQYKVDGKVVLGKPEGMRGSKFEIKTLYITCFEQHLNDIIEAVEEAGISVQDVMASPIAASLVTLNKSQKIAGCVLTNIGAETVSIAVFENNIPVSLEVFPIGSTDITNDIALGLKVPLEEAEQIKIGAITGASYPRKKLEEIISARLYDIFELIEAHLKKIGRNGLLPAGIILIGGGSSLNGIEEMAKNTLRLPSRIGIVAGFKDSAWAVAYGLCILGMHADPDLPIDTSSRIFENSKKTMIAWLKQFLP
ncbi:MAG: cell division protein FtsA [Candidatus Taylorbacteria bacterium]|nr:cell division protein FtsA [Candidatus Taylorbacteria bacterium]